MMKDVIADVQLEPLLTIHAKMRRHGSGGGR
jgi:hypothetical protein